LGGPMEKDVGRLLDRLGVRKNGTILRAAVVLFGKHFLPNFPQCHLMMARFRGTDKTEFMDQKALHGPAFKLLEEAQIFCQRHFPLPGKIIPGQMMRQDTHLIPPDALREILVNAFIHRDYSIAGGSIHLAIFDDRVEVWSAGKLPVGVTPAALSKIHDSVKRNPTIAEAFYRVGLIEMWGRGTNRVIEQCRAASVEPPTFREVDISTVVTFRVLVSTTPQVTDRAGEQDGGQVPDKYRTSTGQVPDKLKLLDYCSHPRGLREMMAHLDLSHRETFMANYLRPLLEQGLLAMVDPESPNSPKQKYVTTPKGLEKLGAS
jgi:ATP-dependent DNA helicase RecG